MSDKSPPPTSQEFAGKLVQPGGGTRELRWLLAEEVPAAVLFNSQFFAVMMVTPADLEDFAVGFSLTENIVENRREIAGIKIAEAIDGYAVNIKIAEHRMAGLDSRRRVLTGRSGCGICGAQTLDAAVARPRPVSGPTPTARAVARAIAELPPLQAINRLNHSTHAAGLADAEGKILAVREDIGRHNALDKLIGSAIRAGTRLDTGFVVLSSRCSMEMVQKAAMAGIPFLASVSAPTALAVRLAAEAGMGLAANNRDGIMFFGPATKAH